VSTTSFPASLFKAYDIRGTVPDLINPDFARALGLALAARARKAGIKAVVVGYDGRLSSPALAQALVDGLTAGGVDALDIGMVPTPGGFLHRLQQAAGLDRDGVVVDVDGAHAVQPRRGQHHGRARFVRRGGAAQAGVAALRHQRHAVPGAGAHHGRHVVGAARPRYRQGRALVTPPPIEQKGRGVRPRQHMIGAQQGLQFIQQSHGGHPSYREDPRYCRRLLRLGSVRHP